MLSPKPNLALTLQHLESDHPRAHYQLTKMVNQLEHQFNEVQRLTFTVEDGQLFVLQAQPAPRSPKAAARIAVEMVKEGSTSKSEAFMKLNPHVSSNDKK
jgi:pyruvate, orthophosphate dikinase